jgi:hypothetical protein
MTHAGDGASGADEVEGLLTATSPRDCINLHEREGASITIVGSHVINGGGGKTFPAQ